MFYFKGDGRLGIGEETPQASVEIANLTTANLLLDGGSDAVIKIDAAASNNFSDIDFSRDGTKKGNIRYDHHATGTSEKMIFNVDASSPLIASGSNQVIIGGTSNVSTQATLEVSGSVIIGSGYVGTQTPLANGLLVEGQLKAGGISIGGAGSTTIAIDAGAANESSDLDFSLTNVTKGRLRYNHNPIATAESMEFQAGGSSVLYITGQSNVGVSVSTPVNKLDIEGALAVGTNYSGAVTAPINGAIFEGNVGIASSVTSNTLDVGGSVAIGNLYAGQFTGPTKWFGSFRGCWYWYHITSK